MKIYTKTGDNGTTRLVDGSCVEKFNLRVEAYGTVDELNSYIGLIYSLTPDTQYVFANSTLKNTLYTIQNNLFVIGSLLATEKQTVFANLPQIIDSDIAELEQHIDAMTSELPELKNFILPTGQPLSAHLHIARTLCRRSERRAAEVAHNHAHYDKVLIYLNRLSDYLFTAARYINYFQKTEDILWKKK